MDLHKLSEVLVVVLFTSSGQLLLRLGMRGINISQLALQDLLGYVIRTPLLWLAIALYAISTLLWMRVLAEFPVGSVYPMVAIGYVLVTIGGIVFLGERVPLQAWIALAVICFGVLLLAAVPWQSAAQ